MGVTIDKPDKLLFPESGYSKADLADYLTRMAPLMRPHLRGRPLTLRRFPDGIAEEGFFQKNVSDHFPDWIERVTVSRREGGEVTHALAEDAATLRFLADQATIELHVWLARVDRPEHPDRLIFDLDPPGEDFAPVIEAARDLRRALEEAGLAAFVMTTGSSGLHVVSPLDRGAGFEAVRDFARETARRLADDRPRDFTTEHRKNRRQGRVYLDVMRNAYGQTGILPYSVRALPGAPVATPLDWRELGRRGLTPRSYHLGNIFRRLAQRDCPWARLDEHAGRVPG